MKTNPLGGPFHSLLRLFAKVLSSSPFLSTGWILLVLITAGIVAAELLVMRETVNTLVAADTHRAALPWVTGLCLLFFGQHAITTLLPLLREKLRVKAGFSLQRVALQKTGTLPLETFDDEDSHNLIKRVVSGSDSHVIQLMQNGLSFIESVPRLLTCAFILGIISIWIPAILITGGLLLRVYEIQLGRRERHFEVENTRLKRLADYYTQLLTERQSAAETRLWDISELLLHRWHESLAEYLRGGLRISFQNGYRGVLYIVVFIATLAGALLMASRAQGSTEAGLAALVITAIWNLGAGMNAIQYYMIQFVQHAGYGEDILHLLEGYPEKSRPLESSVTPHPIQDSIRLQDVTYRYPDADTDALSRVNLNIRPGEILAIVGENGAGKTTLAHILAGLRPPTTGNITRDGIDVTTMSANALQAACTFVFQHPARYPAQLRENLALNNTDVSNKQVEDVLTRVGLSAERYPVDILLGPEFGGVDLSGGEWQRIAIVRSLLKKETDILIFDEPTAALDPLAELEIFKRFVEEVEGKTAILIAHRLGPTRLSDRVVVLEKGCVVEVGTPAELLDKNGKYAQMFAAQREWYQ